VTATEALPAQHTVEDFPLDSLRDAARHLRRPFAVNAVKFKVQAAWPKDNPTKGLVVAYIDARLVVERLNLLLPHCWYDDYEPAGKTTRCRLTVDGVTRQDIGTGDGKAGFSDALKRAGVKFGIGVSLYAIPSSVLQGDMVRGRRTRDGAGLEITDAGDRVLRERYARWLEQEGEDKFGRVLDHGDAAGAIGDPDDIPQLDPEHDAPSPADDIEVGIAGKGINRARAKQIADAAFAVGVEAKLQLAATHVHGDDVGDCSTKNKAAAAMLRLTTEQADKVEAWVSRKADEQSANAEARDA
jgi:hypothetical protein